jgi:hypothetical protein
MVADSTLDDATPDGASNEDRINAVTALAAAHTSAAVRAVRRQRALGNLAATSVSRSASLLMGSIPRSAGPASPSGWARDFEILGPCEVDPVHNRLHEVISIAAAISIPAPGGRRPGRFSNPSRSNGDVPAVFVKLPQRRWFGTPGRWRERPQVEQRGRAVRPGASASTPDNARSGRRGSLSIRTALSPVNSPRTPMMMRSAASVTVATEIQRAAFPADLRLGRHQTRTSSVTRPFRRVRASSSTTALNAGTSTAGAAGRLRAASRRHEESSMRVRL